MGLVAVACAAQAIPPASKIDASNLDSSHLVETLKAHQRQLDPLREQYSFHETAEFLTLGDDGSVEKKTVSDYKMFYVNTHPVRVLLHRNGQPLNEEDATRTQQHLVKDTAKAKKTAPGEATENMMSVWSVLQGMRFTNPRHVAWQGRPSLMLDFTGDPEARGGGIGESIAKKFHGTVWIDEQDWEVAHLEARLDDKLSMAGGLLLQMEKGSSFVVDQRRVNNEIWLPAGMDVTLSGRALLFKSFRQVIHLRDDGYGKASSQQSQVARLVPGGR
jgi:hypothetical protein